MKNLVRIAHEKGIRVMLDGVFNHCGYEFAPWQDVVEKGPNSKYYNWFMVNKWPFEERGQNARKGNYYSFAFSDNMPKLNTNNKELRDYFLDICEMWVREYELYEVLGAYDETLIFVDKYFFGYVMDQNSHLNPLGARKVTDYIGKFMVESLGFSSDCGNDESKKWNEDFELYRKFYDSKIVEETKLENVLPLVTDSQGKKFGKSEGNALWLDKTKTSSYKLYQFFVNVEDSMVIDYLKIYTFLSKEEIEKYEKKNNEHPELREAHKALAREIITFLTCLLILLTT